MIAWMCATVVVSAWDLALSCAVPNTRSVFGCRPLSAADRCSGVSVPDKGGAVPVPVAN